ncbi:MAG: permease [Thermoplasmata archaeon]|nr:permease [Thermoplasmata archaeon]
MADIVYDALVAGANALLGYLSAHVLTCLIPAFFIAGAIAAFVRKDAILKYFGPEVEKWKAYGIAAISGGVLAVCSCTILPIFAGIYKKGSGIGPATTFLFAGPAINILAIVYTAQVLGYDIGAARATCAIVLSVIVGLVMSVVFRKHDESLRARQAKRREEKGKPAGILLAFFGLLVTILIIGGADINFVAKILLMLVLSVVLGFLTYRYFSVEEIKTWGSETLDLGKKIFPVLLAGVFLVGVIAFFLPPETFGPFLSGNSVLACVTASMIGALLYMPTLLEVPVVGTTLGYTSGVIGHGPALSLLLAGPSVSLPGMIVLSRIMGMKKTVAYIILVIGISTICGYIFGILAGG